MFDLVKSYEPVWKAAGAGAPVTADDLALINRYALTPLAAEEVYVRRMRLCNDQHDRSLERFPVAYLERFAATLPGKALLPNHNSGGGWQGAADQPTALGRFFAATLEAEAGVTSLVPAFYMLRTPANEETRRQIDAGVWAHVSIGARVDRLFCDLCGKDYYAFTTDEAGRFTGCPHVVGRRYGDATCTLTWGGDLTHVEALEGSIVWLGCQLGAEMTKAAGTARADKEAMLMEIETESGPPPADAAPAARLAALEAERAGLAPLVTDGRLYRADLQAEMRRLAALVGAEKECAALLAAAADAFDAPRLKELVAEYQARFERAFPPRGAGVPAAAAASPGVRAAHAHALI